MKVHTLNLQIYLFFKFINAEKENNIRYHLLLIFNIQIFHFEKKILDGDLFCNLSICSELI